jgi:hypothetical protein
MFDVFVGKPLAARTLSEPNTLAERAIICFAVRCVKSINGETAFNADWHRERKWLAHLELSWVTGTRALTWEGFHRDPGKAEYRAEDTIKQKKAIRF